MNKREQMAEMQKIVAGLGTIDIDHAAALFAQAGGQFGFATPMVGDLISIDRAGKLQMSVRGTALLDRFMSNAVGNAYTMLRVVEGETLLADAETRYWER